MFVRGLLERLPAYLAKHVPNLIPQWQYRDVHIMALAPNLNAHAVDCDADR
jgi:hypothetical protein